MNGDYETKPTIETLLEEMRKGFSAIAEQFKIVNTRLTRIEAKLDILNNRLLGVEADLVLHDERLASLEGKRPQT